MTFLKIWFSIFLVGLIFYPLTSSIFKNYKDRGWLFSKVIGICISSWFIWFLSSIKILPYNRLTSYLVIFLFAIINLGIIIFKYKNEPFKIKKSVSIIKSSIKNFYKSISIKDIKHIIISELIFITAFAFWSFVKGFRPEITNSTEQFMDYGYMNASMNSEYMPPNDIWLSGKTINYYYFGQYASGFICKISYTNASSGYNYIIAFISACTFALPFSIGYNLFSLDSKNKKEKHKAKKQIIIPIIAAISIGFAVSLGGSLHYPIYRWLNPINDEYTYVDETRYIGYKPETQDKTANEVPAYSAVVGDLHAHYVDLVFSLAIIGLLSQFFIQKEEEKETKKNINLALLGLMLGICKMTNYWDFPIYIVIISAMVIAKKLICGKCNKESIITTLYDLVKIIVIEEILTIPFTLNLYVVSTKVYLTGITSPFYKMLVKWGLPTIVSLLFLWFFLNKYKKDNIKFKKYLNDNLPQLFMIILSLCAIGLVLLPEIIYLKDIYDSQYKRFNTMFKLTYQAFLLFGICISYFLLKLSENKNKLLKIFAIILMIINSTTFLYGIDTIFTNYKDTEHVGISEDTTEKYIKDSMPDDYDAIKWIKDNIPRDKIILEHTEYGNSFTSSARISTFTGNSTVLGWSYHEWLWRAEENFEIPKTVETRNNDIWRLYNSNDINEIKTIINIYNIDYIYIGNLEINTYQDMNIDLLKSMGEVVFRKNNTYLIEIQKN